MPSSLKIATIMRGKIVINGETRNKNSTISTTAIIQANNKFCELGVLPEGVKNKGSSQQISNNILNAIGCSIDPTTDREFSLLTQQTDTEVIQNPNIMDDTKWEELKNENILAIDKFPSVNDNFFQPDYPISITAKNQWLSTNNEMELVGNTQKLVQDLIEVNLEISYKPTLPQFK